MAKLTHDEIKWILSIDAKGANKEIAATSSEINQLTSSNRLMNKEMKAAERQMKQQERVMERLARAGKQDSLAYQEAKGSMQSARGEMEMYIKKISENNRAIDSNQKKLKELKDGMGLNEMSMNQLRTRAYDLQRQLNVTSLAANPKEYKALQKELTATRNRIAEVENSGRGMMEQFASMNGPVGIAARAVQGFGSALKALIANPVGAVIMAIVVVFTAFKKAINSSEEAANKFNQIMAPLRVIMDKILNVVQKLVKGFLDLTLGFMKWASSAIEKLPFIGKKMKEINDAAAEGVEIEKEKLALKIREREALVDNARKESEIAELRNKARQRDLYTNEEIIEMLDQAMELEKEIAEEKIEQAKIKLNLLELENRHTDNVEETNQAIAEQTALIYQLESNYQNSTRRMVSERSARIREMKREDAAAAKAAIDQRVNSIDFALQQELLRLKQQQADRLISEKEYNTMAETATIDALSEKLKIAGLEKDKRIDIERQILDYKIEALNLEKEIAAERVEILKEYEARARESGEREIGEIEDRHAVELEKLEEALARQIITEKEYNNMVAQARAERDHEIAEKENEQREAEAEERLQQLANQKELEKMAIQQAYNSELISRAEYNDALLDLDQQYNALALQLDQLTADQRRTLQQEALDFATAAMEQETATQEAEQEKREQLYTRFSQQIGQTLGAHIAGNESMVKSSLKAMITMALDALEAQVTMAIASATAQSFAQADSVATFGASGAARAGILTALIKGAFAGVKAIVNSALSGGSAKTSTPTGSTPAQTGARTIVGKQNGGFMNVRRAQDGKRYNAIYDPAVRGYIDRPTVLVGDGPAGQSREWVASNEALQNPTIAPIIEMLNQAQMQGNIRTIDVNQLMRTRLAGFESGGYISPAPSIREAQTSPALLNDIRDILDHLKTNGVKAPVVLTELQRQQELLKTSQKIGSKR